ncbi:MAG: hypothetical protein AAGI11_14815 [Pseudomonadota bacterium]
MELVAVHEGEALPLNASTSLWLSRRNGKSFPLANHLIEPLRSCSTLRSVDDHIQSLLPRLQGQADAASLQAIFRSLGDAGLLTYGAHITERFAAQTDVSPEELAPTRVFILTCDRSSALERLLRSIEKGADLSWHEALIVLDDSRDESHARRNRDALRAVQPLVDVPVHYVGQGQKRAYLDALAARHPHLEPGLSYLLDREHWPGQRTYGLARNWALVLSCGRRCIMLDDDSLCEGYYLPDSVDAVSLADQPRGLQAFASEPAWREGLRPLEQDPLSVHRNHLGLPLSHSLELSGVEALGNKELTGLGPAEQIHLSPASPLLMTQSGYLGDPGSPMHPVFLNSDQQTLENLLRSDPDLSLSFGRRQFRVAQSAVTYTARGNMSLITGLDNRYLLPPYLPAGRGEDVLHAWVLHQMYPQSRVINFNWATPHLPVEQRGSDYRGEAVIPGMSPASLLHFLDNRYRLRGLGSAESRLAFYAAAAHEMADLDGRDFVGLARREASRYPARVFARCNERLPYFSGRAPAFERYLQYASSEALSLLQQPRPLAQEFGMDDALNDLQVAERLLHGIRGLADALTDWPAIRAACADIDLADQAIFPPDIPSGKGD